MLSGTKREGTVRARVSEEKTEKADKSTGIRHVVTRRTYHNGRRRAHERRVNSALRRCLAVLHTRRMPHGRHLQRYEHGGGHRRMTATYGECVGRVQKKQDGKDVEIGGYDSDAVEEMREWKRAVERCLKTARV